MASRFFQNPLYIVLTVTVAGVIAAGVLQLREQPSNDLSDASSTKSQSAAEKNISEKERELRSLLNDPVPEDFPVSARKLHKVLNETDLQPEEPGDLEQQMQDLNLKLVAIEEKLEEEGISLPVDDVDEDPELSDIEARLKNIRDHLQKSPADEKTDNSI